MSAASVQQVLFKHVKDILPSHLSMPEELAALLNISVDSAYRRIRGEKMMDLGELQLTCDRSGISLDPLLGYNGGSYLFQGRIVGQEDLPVSDWIIGMSDQLTTIARMHDPVFVVRAEDIPTFHYFQFPELTQFKLFFWRRTILNDPAFQNKKFKIADREEDQLALARKVYLAYKELPYTEIWNADSLNAFLLQITFYHEAGLFANEGDVQIIFDRLQALLDHLHVQVEAGVKFLMGEASSTGGATFKVYVNEVMQGDNMIFVASGDKCKVFVDHSAINYISTADPVFWERTRTSIENVMRKGVLISGTGEKERDRFFKALHDEVERRRSLML